MKNIQIVGMGCPKCTQFFELAENVAKELGISYKIEKIQDITAIMALGVTVTPALLVDGEMKAAGKIPSKEDVKKFLL